ncbi:MAG: FAD-dependent oxidoreductase [Gemmatimonas sp.]
MRNPSLWSLAESSATFPALQSNRQYDVIVVGGGITGLTTAYLLKRSGKRVCVLERNRIGTGETQHTSAHLTHVTDYLLRELVDRFGEDSARRVWEVGLSAIDTIEQIVNELHIDCEFERVPCFVYSAQDADNDESSTLQDEAALARSMGFESEFIATLGEFQRPAVKHSSSALFHPIRYIQALARAVAGDGSDVFENSNADEFSEDPLTVTVNGHRIRGNVLILATHVPLMGIASTLSATVLQTKLFPYSSYVLHATVDDHTIDNGLYNDTADPYRYLRVHRDSEGVHLVFGWNDHKTGQEKDTEACFASLEQELLRLFPAARIHERWSGQVIETSDGLPFIGWHPEKQFIATGYSGNGLTFGTLAAVMAHDAVLNRSDATLMDLFDPARKNVRGAMTTVRESSDYPMYLAADWLRLHAHKVSEISVGQAAVLSIDGHKVACHRTGESTVRAVSAVCTHLGCLVHWNNAEETWDCPCHGSRFSNTGEVIGGPAEEPLRRIAISDKS